MRKPRIATGRAVALSGAPTRVNPFKIHQYAHGLVEEVPDPIEFVVSDKFLDRPNLYPRQATILKVMFLRDDMFCADEQTEILTRRGWKPYWEVIEGEDVMTISPATGLAEWAPAERVNVFPTQSERLISMEGSGHSSLTTPNHRWLVDRLYTTERGSRRERQFVETQDLIGTRDRIACAARVTNLPDQAKWTDAFVELAAWYWTEGHLRAGGGIVIAQSEVANPAYVQRIRACLTTLFGSESHSLRGNVTGWRESRDQGMAYFRLSVFAAAELRSVIEGPEKVPAADFLTGLTQAQLQTFIETSIDADGSRYTMPSGKVKRDITQKSKARLDALQMACSLAGVRTVLAMKPVRGSGPYAGREHWHLSLYDDRSHFTPQTRGRKFAITEVEHTGHVWCPTTKNGTWLARRNGKVYFTGNTQYDYDVIGEWEETFLATGNEGISPGVLDRIRINRERGRSWFRETLGVIGRRGGKGYIGGLSGAYVTWTYMHRPGGPQAYYGIDRDKRLTGVVFAGKKEQARDNLWRDWTNVILGGPCFAPYISRPQAERLTIYAPTDVLKVERAAAQGIVHENDIASFEIVPAPSTVMAARGPAMFCLDPSTPVLTSDLRWVPIGSLQPGDELVGVDEFPERKGAQRKMRRAEVLGVRRTRDRAYRLTFDDGSDVVCSPDHRWLTREMGRGTGAKWRFTKTLSVGNRISWIVDPWGEDNTAEGGYLKGFFDGEGCVSGWSQRGGKTVYFSQNDGPVLDHVLRLLADRGYHLDKNTDQSEQCRQWKFTGSAQAMRFLGSVRPIRLIPKAAGVWEGVAPRGGATPSRPDRRVSYKTITQIEELPEQDLVDIETSTRTFIANGLVSHNCEMFDEQAHVISSTAAADAEAVYDAATPALDQFKQDGFIYAPSSPWRKTGKFFENWEHAIEMEADGTPAYPERLMIQLPSWGPYEDWEEAERIPLRPPSKTVIEVEVEVRKKKVVKGKTKTVTVLETQQVERAIPGPTFRALKNAVQTYDDQMRSLERANPDTFAVERRCLDPDTRVLMADLTWRRIDDVEPGDAVVACDEYGSEGSERKMRIAIVEAKADSVDTAYRVEFDDGTSVTCSGRHRWLSSSAGSRSNFRWRSIEPQGTMGPRSVMKPGDTIRALTDTWSVDESRGGGWLAGLYDGEGCVVSRKRLRTEFRIDLTQNRGVVLDEALALLRERGFNPKDASHHSREAQCYKIVGLANCLRLLGQIRPLRLLQNGNPGMWEGRAFGHERGRRFVKTITSITPLPRQRLVDIQTSTRTFIAEGLVSHNSHWAESLDAYLNAKKVEEMFQPWNGETLHIATRGTLDQTYVAHGDPANTNKRFGWSLGHRVWVPDESQEAGGMYHVVFDVIRCWDPADFEDHILDYDVVMDDIEVDVKTFVPEDVSFDQFNVPATIGRLRKFVRREELPKAVTVREVSRTRNLNWRHAELFKAALNMGLVHAPMLKPDGEVNYASSEAELELKFLEEKNGAVDHPSTGPVQTKDIADTLMEVVVGLIGKQMATFLGQEFTEVGISGAAPRGTDPYRKTTAQERLGGLTESAARGMAQPGAARARGGGMRRR